MTEAQIQAAIVKEMIAAGWYTKRTVGTIASSGWPDLWVTHKNYGSRWVEIKKPVQPDGSWPSHWTPAQIEVFGAMTRNGSGVWVLTGVGQLARLCQPPNYYLYLDPGRRRAYECITVR